jgi:hypothetical protein
MCTVRCCTLSLKLCVLWDVCTVGRCTVGRCTVGHCTVGRCTVGRTVECCTVGCRTVGCCTVGCTFRSKLLLQSTQVAENIAAITLVLRLFKAIAISIRSFIWL